MKMTTNGILKIINHIPVFKHGKVLMGLSAYVVDFDYNFDGFDITDSIAITIISDGHIIEPVGDIIEPIIKKFGLPLEFITSEESSSIAWYKIK